VSGLQCTILYTGMFKYVLKPRLTRDMDPSVKSAARNRVLGALPPSVRALLMPSFEPVRLHMKEVLYEVHAPVKHIYFVLSGVASLIANTEGDDGIEVATIGNEGMVGLPAFLGAETAALRVFVQVPGEALRMPVETFRRHCASNEDLMTVLLRYTQALMTVLRLQSPSSD
jgi:CRP-like cAMP-binding protein